MLMMKIACSCIGRGNNLFGEDSKTKFRETTGSRPPAVQGAIGQEPQSETLFSKLSDSFSHTWIQPVLKCQGAVYIEYQTLEPGDHVYYLEDFGEFVSDGKIK